MQFEKKYIGSGEDAIVVTSNSLVALTEEGWGLGVDQCESLKERSINNPQQQEEVCCLETGE